MHKTRTPQCVKLNTYDPGYNKNLHPGERRGLHTEELQWVIAGGHVGQQRRSAEAVDAVEDQQTKKHDKGSGVGHKLQEGSTHEFPQLREKTRDVF